MTNETKTMEQIYMEKYTINLFGTNPLCIVEAMGYLKALEQFIPNESWIKYEKMFLLTTLMILKKEGVIKW